MHKINSLWSKNFIFFNNYFDDKFLMVNSITVLVMSICENY